MNKLKETLYQFRNYLGHFTKRPKKKGKPKLTIANKKTVNLAVLSGLAFILLVGLLGGIRAMTLSSQVTDLKKAVMPKQKRATTLPAYLGFLVCLPVKQIRKV